MTQNEADFLLLPVPAWRFLLPLAASWHCKSPATGQCSVVFGQLRQEIETNDAFLKVAIGPDFLAQTFACPFGEISVAAKWQCSRRFQTARSVMPGLNRTGADADQLRILPIDNIFADQTDWTTVFDAVAQKKAWAIVLAHGVDSTGHPYRCPPDRLEGVVQRAIAAGLDILPVTDVMGRQAQVSA